MTQSIQKHLLIVMALAAWVSIGILPSDAQPPVRHADADYDASGYVTPTGMVHPSMYLSPTGYGSGIAPGSVAQVGFFDGGCDANCDAMGGCDACSGGGGCDSPSPCDGNDSCGSGLFDVRGGSCSGACGGRCQGGCGGRLLQGGLMGQMRGDCGCGRCGNCLSKIRHMCLFCGGEGCSACQLLGRGYLLGALASLRPYTEGGLCAQRWYDLSAEATFLSHNGPSGVGGALTSQGVGPLGPIVLRTDDADNGGDLEEGMRLSASFIFGAGGNIEGTYFGGNEWNSEASVSDPSAGLFSFISDFGTNPGGAPAGFDDTDRSLVQSIQSESEFHSAEINYRRRTMGPYCRFQGSWLVGLRYLRYQDGLIYSTLGENNNTVNANLPRFFSSDDRVKNNLFGPQAGFDLWWNMRPGVSLGIGVKSAWVQNDIDRRTVFTGNSLNVGSPGTTLLNDSGRDTTVMGEFEFKLAYRLSHSWTIRSAYYVIGVEDVAYGAVEGETIRDFVTANLPLAEPALRFDSLVIQGFSFGTEYTW